MSHVRSFLVLTLSVAVFCSLALAEYPYGSGSPTPTPTVTPTVTATVTPMVTPTAQPSPSPSPVGRICTNQLVATQRIRLLHRAYLLWQEWEGEGRPHFAVSGGSRPFESFSTCWSCVTAFLEVLNEEQESIFSEDGITCWDCREEWRMRARWPDFRPFGHKAVVCKTEPPVAFREMLVDYWGDRQLGEDPEIWFRRRYPCPYAEESTRAELCLCFSTISEPQDPNNLPDQDWIARPPTPYCF